MNLSDVKRRLEPSKLGLDLIGEFRKISDKTPAKTQVIKMLTVIATPHALSTINKIVPGQLGFNALEADLLKTFESLPIKHPARATIVGLVRAIANQFPSNEV